MGKVRTRILGFEDLELEQKKAAKERAAQKKASVKKDGAESAAVDDVAKSQDGLEKDLGNKTQEESKKKASKKTTEGSVAKQTRGAKYKKSSKLASKDKEYSLDEAIQILKKMAYASFTESVEVHANLNATGLRGELQFPHSTGKNIRVAIVDEKLLEQLESGVIDFDVLVSHPSMMPKLAKFARVLGPKGLMPSPKIGTISDKPEEVAKKFSGGLVRWRSEAKFPILHQAVAKVDQKEQEIAENVRALVAVVGKGNVTSVFIATTMSPSLRIQLDAFA